MYHTAGIMEHLLHTSGDGGLSGSSQHPPHLVGKLALQQNVQNMAEVNDLDTLTEGRQLRQITVELIIQECC